jgi:hypothetical protein
MSDDNETNLPAILVCAVVILAVLIGGFGWLAVKRQRAMEAELQAMKAMEALYRAKTAASGLWWGSENVKDVKKAKMLFEDEVILVKRRGGPRSAIGKNLYGKAKKSTDSCIDYLITAIARGFDKLDDLTEIKKRMEESDRDIRAVSAWERIEPSGEEDDIQVLERLPNWVEEFKTTRQSKEELDRIKDNLEKCRLRNWDDLE